MAAAAKLQLKIKGPTVDKEEEEEEEEEEDEVVEDG